MSSDSTATAPTPSPEYMAESMSGSIQAIMWTFTAFALIFVLLRCYTRLVLRRVFGVDDYIMVLAMMVLLTYSSIISTAAARGLGRHIEYVLQDPQNAVYVAFLCQLSQPFVIMSCAFGKTSFGLTLMRVAAQRWIHYVLWFIIITMNIAHITICTTLFTRCKDPRMLWDTSIQPDCWPSHVFVVLSLVIGIYSAASDFALALMPWAMLWNLQMKKREKTAVAIAMSLGIVAGSVAIVKTTKLAANTAPADATWVMGPLLWWAGIENCLIIIGACVPTLRPVLKKIFPTTSAKRSEDSNSHALKPLPSRNMFMPKAKQGQWSAIIETEMHNDHASDDQSDKGILKQGGRDAKVEEALGPVGGADRTSGRGPPHIKKTTQVDVIYGNRSEMGF